MRKAAVVLIILLLAAGSIFGVSLDELYNSSLTKTQIEALKSGELPTEIQFKDINPCLIPRHEELRRFVASIQQDLNPSVMVETLYIYQKPQKADKTAWTAAEQAKLYNEVIALSTLKGIQYYSASRGTMRTLYETSSVIDSPSGKKPLPDPVYSAPPAELTLFARQKDLTFGDNFYQYTYHPMPGALVFVQENLSSMTAGILPAVGKNKLRSVAAILDAGDSLLIYAVSMAKVAALPGIKNRMGDSFSNRAEAILQWVAAGADRAFGM